MVNIPDDQTTESVEADVDLQRQENVEKASSKQTSASNDYQDVKEIQQKLLDLGFNLMVDGIVGRQTTEAVRQFQAQHNLKVSGDLDDQTLEQLFSQQPKLTLKPKAVNDEARKSIEDDRLGFAPYVDGLTTFLRSEDTEAPLAIAITAGWGEGKTTMMGMVDSELHKLQRGSKKFATAWYNPWKYRNETEAWGALVTTITQCIRSSMSWRSQIRFELQLFYCNLKNNFTFGLLYRLLLTIAIFGTALFLLFSPDTADLLKKIGYSLFDKEVMDELTKGQLSFPVGLIGALAFLYIVQQKVIKEFHLGLVDYLQEHGFDEKVSSLDHFEQEMKIRNSCIPADTQVIVFIDDLDRCSANILGEVLQSLQLLEVSRRCIFILGMDINIVCRTIEEQLPGFRRAVGYEDDLLEHGHGYRFLEKIMQARISLPTTGEADLLELASYVIDRSSLPDDPADMQKPEMPLMTRSASLVKGLFKGTETPVRDSEELAQLIERYGSRHFTNPRRLKRFINSFRLQFYLASIADVNYSPELLMRFVVLAEKYPGLIDYLRQSEENYDRFFSGSEENLPDHISSARSKAQIQELLNKPLRLQYVDIINLADLYGFQFCRFERERRSLPVATTQL